MRSAGTYVGVQGNQKSRDIRHSLVNLAFGLLLLLSHFSHVQLCATPKTAAHQDPPSLGFSRQEHWSGLPLPSPGLWVRALLLNVLDLSPFIKIKYFQCMLEIHFLLRRPHYILTRSRWWGKISAVKLHKLGTFLVVQWLRIHLPIQGTQVWFLVQEDPTCSGATKAHEPQLLSPHSRALEIQWLSPCPATTEVQVP